MKIVVTGARGTIGQVLMKAIKKQGNEAIAFDRDAVDITDKEKVEHYLYSLQPDRIYHLAKASLAFTEILGAWAYQNKVKLVFTSSFKVFSGKKVEGPYSIFDEPDGTDAFAQGKIAQEKALFEYYPYTYVVRLAWQIAKEPTGYNFLTFVKDQVDKRGTYHASKQHLISFMFIEDTTEALLNIPNQYPPGLFHLNANEYYSVYDVVMNLKSLYNLDWIRVDDKKRYAKNDTMESNVSVKTFSDYGFKFYSKSLE